jgi:peptidoglycan/LPS O-acetylase OafA/YrhL
VVGHARALLIKDAGEVSELNPLQAAAYLLSGMGHNAVVVFFVLSGYWVGGQGLRAARRGRFSVKQYAISRLTRLWLVLLPALLLLVVVDRVGLHFFGDTQVYAGDSAYHGVAPVDIWHRLQPMVLLGNVVFLQTITVPTAGSNGALWSLAYEFYYYVAFAAAVVLVAARTRHSSRLLAGAVLVGMSILYGWHVLQLAPAWIAGVAVSVWSKSSRPRICQRLPTLTLTLFATAVCRALLPPGPVADLTLAAVVTVVLALTASSVPITAVAKTTVRGLNWVGDFSFSLYVLHLPLLVLLGAWSNATFGDRAEPDLVAFGLVAIASATCCGIAWAFSFVTERRTKDIRTWFEIRASEAQGT